MLYFWKLYRSHCSSKFMSTHSYTHTAVELQPDLPTVYTTSPCVAATMLATHSLLPWSVEQLWAWPNLTRICGVEHAARLFLGPKSWGEHHCQRAQVGLRLGTSMCNLSFLHLFHGQTQMVRVNHGSLQRMVTESGLAANGQFE